MRSRRFTRAATLLATAVLAACALLSSRGATPAEAVEAGIAFPTSVAPGFVLEGVKWTDRTRVDVYYTWGGGPCILGDNDFSGPASTIAPDIALTQLRAAIDDINLRLRGGLTLSLAGEATRADLCGQSTTKAIVIGWGAIQVQGATGRAYYGSTVGAGTPETIRFARVLIRNDEDFACPDGEAYRDLRHVMTHEMLHALGIGHSTDPTAVMAPISTFCQSAATLQPDDIAALAALYPPPPGPSGNEPAATPVPTAPVTVSLGAGIFSSTPSFSAGGQALAVFNGGTLAQLEAAAKSAGATGVWAQQADGAYRLYVIGGPVFVNDAFRTAFAAGFAGPTAFTLTR